MEGVRAAVLSTATLGEAVRLLGNDPGYKLQKHEKNETAAGYAKRIGHVDALIELAKYDLRITAMDIVEASHRSLDPKGRDKAEDFLAARAIEGETVSDKIRRSGTVDMLIMLANNGGNITPADVLVAGARSENAADKKKARDFFREKIKIEAMLETPVGSRQPVAAAAIPA
jgi:hypothetical protein